MCLCYVYTMNDHTFISTDNCSTTRCFLKTISPNVFIRNTFLRMQRNESSKVFNLNFIWSNIFYYANRVIVFKKF